MKLFLILALATLAGNYADIAHEAFESKNYPRAGEFYEKAYKEDKNEVYRQNAISAYLTHSFDLSTDNYYDQAILFCQKILSLEPGNKNARELLSDIYYSRGSNLYFMGHEQQARADMESSLRYATLAEQRERVQLYLEKFFN